MVYEKYGGDKVNGYYEFFTPTVSFGDPEILKSVMIKDFDHFTDRRVLELNSDYDAYAKDMLVNAQGEHWKGIRSVISPSFSSGKIKTMFHVVMGKADTLLAKWYEMQEKGEVGIKRCIGKYTMDVIATCAFAIEPNCIVDETSEFEERANEVFTPKASRMIQFFIFVAFPKLAQLLGIHLMERFAWFKEVVTQTIAQRTESGDKRNDFLNILLEMKEDQEREGAKSQKYPLSDQTILAECLVFLLAGYNTSVNTLTFAAFLLATHPDKQEILRDEINEFVDDNGDFDYTQMMEANYLDSVLSEALRMYPPAALVDRTCTKDYIVPGTNIRIPKGMPVTIPIWSVHHDERYWPNPEEFEPERFMPDRKHEIKQGTFMGFGMGPRHCPAARFALMEAKLLLAKLVYHFSFLPAPGHEKMVLFKGPGIIRPKDDVNMIFTPLRKPKLIIEKQKQQMATQG